jgi:hypothetical protein
MHWLKVTTLIATMIGMSLPLGCVGNDVPDVYQVPDGGHVESDGAASAPGPCKLGSAVLGKCVLE